MTCDVYKYDDIIPVAACLSTTLAGRQSGRKHMPSGWQLVNINGDGNCFYICVVEFLLRGGLVASCLPGISNYGGRAESAKILREQVTEQYMDLPLPAFQELMRFYSDMKKPNGEISAPALSGVRTHAAFDTGV
jgi:hypothetical protein